jgi:regulator of ribonuclease activity A
MLVIMTNTIRTADLCDAHSERVRVLTPGLRAHGGRTLFHGQAETVRAENDNTRVKEALSEAGNGRVLIVDNAASLARALVGGNLAALGAKNGWSGIIVCGAVRDTHELEATDIGVLALATVPMRTDKQGKGTRGVPVRVCGVTIHPGDWVYADPDGVIAASEPLHDR